MKRTQKTAWPTNMARRSASACPPTRKFMTKRAHCAKG
jgi:hypothetical protein